MRRILANNPSPFTFKGTVSYIVGHGKVAIIDPGPEDDAHIGALLDAVRGETVTAIFVTHTHRDHSPAVPRSRQRPARLCYAEGPHRPRGRSMSARPSASMPATIWISGPIGRSADSEVVTGNGWTIEALTTPGHTANHMAFALRKPT